MLLLTAYLILPVIMMTQAQDVISEAENINQDLQLPALSESLLLYDVLSDSPISEINDALSVVNVRHSFKVVGENRYIVVITNDKNSTDTQHVTFPAGSRVTQYPVEHIGDFLKMFGFDHGWSETDTEDVVSNGQDLTMSEWEFITPPNTPTCVFKKRFAAFGLEYLKAHSEVKPVSLSAVARYPPKIFFIMNLEGNKMQEATMEGLDAIGGPGNVRITMKTITKI